MHGRTHPCRSHPETGSSALRQSIARRVVTKTGRLHTSTAPVTAPSPPSWHGRAAPNYRCYLPHHHAATKLGPHSIRTKHVGQVIEGDLRTGGKVTQRAHLQCVGLRMQIPVFKGEASRPARCQNAPKQATVITAATPCGLLSELIACDHTPELVPGPGRFEVLSSNRGSTPPRGHFVTCWAAASDPSRLQNRRRLLPRRWHPRMRSRPRRGAPPWWFDALL